MTGLGPAAAAEAASCKRECVRACVRLSSCFLRLTSCWTINLGHTRPYRGAHLQQQQPPPTPPLTTTTFIIYLTHEPSPALTPALTPPVCGVTTARRACATPMGRINDHHKQQMVFSICVYALVVFFLRACVLFCPFYFSLFCRL